MYTPRIEDRYIKRLFLLKEGFKKLGQRMTMVTLVREALERYLPLKEQEVRQKLDVQKEATDG